MPANWPVKRPNAKYDVKAQMFGQMSLTPMINVVGVFILPVTQMAPQIYKAG